MSTVSEIEYVRFSDVNVDKETRIITPEKNGWAIEGDMIYRVQHALSSEDSGTHLSQAQPYFSQDSPDEFSVKIASFLNSAH